MRAAVENMTETVDGDDDADDRIDIDEVCAMLGGKKKPVNRSTVYRSITKGLLSPPSKFGGMSRWSKRKTRAEIKRAAGEA